MENTEIFSFYKELIQEVKTSQFAVEEGAVQEQCFTKIVTDILADSGESENVIIAYDEKRMKIGSQSGIHHKINAYAIYSNYETVDLFISIYEGRDEIRKLPKQDIDKAFKRISNFFQNAVERNWAEHVEESSEIFQFAHTLNSSEELRRTLVRVNVYVLCDGLYTGEVPQNRNIAGYLICHRIIDLDYLFNITQKSHTPIEINFKKDGYFVQCISCDVYNEEYKSYLAIIPGAALASIYELYGQRLLEQNVRSFLQFSGKVNKGIRNTIIKEPHMFFAYNNGISVTAEEILLENDEKSNKTIISWVKDFQIVNGGQTTASIYHTYKKDKANIEGIFVPVKISLISNKKNFNEIISKISEFSNTQNKVSVTDLSSNRPFHVKFEKLSRVIWIPPREGLSIQSRWFYERSRGQYKNERNRERFIKGGINLFDIKNPKNQMFNKEDLAKYINSYQEVYYDDKLVIGPHFVVRGNQKNYVQFMNYNMIDKPDNIYFEDAVAKAILFRTAEKLYGVKPNSIGDLRYITVPYSIAYFGHFTNYKLNLNKIWKNQSVSECIKKELNAIMYNVEKFIKQNAPGALYAEWAKKEECWDLVKSQDFGIQKEMLKDDMGVVTRSGMSDHEIELLKNNADMELIKSIPLDTWLRIERWGQQSGMLSPEMQNIAHEIYSKNRNHENLDHIHLYFGKYIIDKITKYDADILSRE